MRQSQNTSSTAQEGEGLGERLGVGSMDDVEITIELTVRVETAIEDVMSTNDVLVGTTTSGMLALVAVGSTSNETSEELGETVGCTNSEI